MATRDPQNLGDTFRRSAEQYGSKVAYRLPVKGGKFEDLTYAEAWERVFSRAKALSAAGLTRGDRVVILGESSFEWAVTDWAAQTLGIVTVPVYPTLPADQARYIAKDCGATVAICQNDEQAAKLPDLTCFVWEEGSSASVQGLEGSGGLSTEEWNAEIDKGQPKDLATIIYTSGTTGNPKGVMLLNESFLFLNKNIHSSLPVSSEDTFLSWLPLSHVFERYAGHVLPIAVGATIAYSSIPTIGNDMMKVKPTIILCVPRFLDSVKGRIVDGVRKQGGLKEKMFEMALAQGNKKRAGGFAPLHGVLDNVVGTKIRERTGGIFGCWFRAGRPYLRRSRSFIWRLG